MNRRRAVALVVIVALLLVALAALRWAMRAETVGRFLLDMAGAAAGLEIEAAEFDYRLRGTPDLVAHGVVARVPGNPSPLLSADRVLLSVPWATLRARGAVLDVQRLELDAPVLDLPAFQRWWAQRPAGDGAAPAFVDGIRIVDGRIDADGWRLEALDVDLPRFAMDAPLRAHARGRYVAASLQAPFDLHMAMTRVAAQAGIGIAGTTTPATTGWRLPAWLRLSGHLDTRDGRIAVQRTTLALRGRLQLADATHPLVTGIAGDLLLAGGGLRIEPLAVSLRGQGLLPQLRAGGNLVLHDGLSLVLDGSIAEWPAAWPLLPPPLDRVEGPTPFALGYDGAPDLSAPLALRLARADACFEGRVRLDAIAGWLDQLDAGTPLPPVTGTFHAPALEIPGAILHGVEIRIHEETVDDDRARHD
ncbi:hypothetical protein E5843_05695 [Luteimonas yindakuii]|uniref:hypothetical protein n=1 Tax=Luteimonas yindakuii TaxID=2565782 RepID=UPI0011079650|nr:hypothetical protein [Luteimonas yindakuii]QCO67401.2 hypothetical protein E5843_05695 [Luteimonas yindakuii]